ncbi:BF2992 family fimbrillin-A clan protein [uncultured Rikenella sp.]|uniref:BF2992 family fimbrillin-A clan protein n=1 Tax=uncultured Rikenella sp. TaxID=368003 RepID=UPI00261AA871|nr:BF2992 family fimbrillin-A clan protein [uncultured Rikenella sp.]
MKRFFAVLLCSSMFGIWSCKHDGSYPDPDANRGKTFPVEFSAGGGNLLSGAATKTNLNLTEGTTVRVLVYKRASGGAAADPAADTYVTENTYKIQGDGSFLPCVTDAAGVVTSEAGSVMELSVGNYDFYAYAPAAAMTSRPTLQVGHGADLIATGAVTRRVAGKRTNVDLLFGHKASQLHFTVTRKTDANTVYAVSMQDAGVKVEKLAHAPATYRLGGNIAVSGTAYDGVSEVPGSRFTQIDDCTTAVLDTILPRAANTSAADDLTLTFHLLINNSLYKTYTATLPNRDFLPGNRYLFNVTVKDGGAVLTLFELLPWTNNAMTDMEVGGDASNGIVLGEWTETGWSTGLGDEGTVPF